MSDEANPEAGAITDEQSAVSHIASLLESVEGNPEQGDDPEANREPEEQPEERLQRQEAEPEERAEEPETSSEEPKEAEPEDAQEALPDTLTGLAEALDVEPEQFLDYVKATVKTREGVKDVTLSEAIKGYQLESDYRQKTSEVAETRRQMDAERQQLSERWQQEVQRLDDAIASAESLLDTGLSPEEEARLVEEDPQALLRLQLQQRAQQEKLAKAKDERDRLRKEAVEKQSHELAQYRHQQQLALTEKLPELRDPEKLSAFERQSADYLKNRGFSDDEIGAFFGGAFDHRHVLIIRDAAKFRAMANSDVPKKLKGLPKVQKPGAAQERERGADDKLLASKDRLRRLRSKGTRTQQEEAAFDYVRRIL